MLLAPASVQQTTGLFTGQPASAAGNMFGSNTASSGTSLFGTNPTNQTSSLFGNKPTGTLVLLQCDQQYNVSMKLYITSLKNPVNANLLLLLDFYQ